jgi:diacylglycerol kinase
MTIANGQETGSAPAAGDLDARLAEWGEPEPWTARAGRRDAREKLRAGLMGLKHAFRGDSSFFAHSYRGLLIAMAAGLLGVGPSGWCFLVLAAALVLIAELNHSAVDTLARALGDPEGHRLKVAREIATAGVLVAVVVFAAVSVTVLLLKLNELLGWWH